MSDLQCPTVVLLLTLEVIVECDLHDYRLSGVFVASSIEAESRSLEAAKRLAAHAACQLTMADLADGKSLAEEIEQLADMHRGETIAVVATRSAICAVLGRTDPPTQPIAISIDSDGRTVLPGSAQRI